MTSRGLSSVWTIRKRLLGPCRDQNGRRPDVHAETVPKVCCDDLAQRLEPTRIGIAERALELALRHDLRQLRIRKEILGEIRREVDGVAVTGRRPNPGQ